MDFSKAKLEAETDRLQLKLSALGWSREACLMIAPLTLQINLLKKEKNAIILAHSYQTPDIIYGVADFTGDSYALSLQASKTSADTIIFAGVRFMAQTAKILNPHKRVFLPSLDAGCSLADGITADDVRMLKRKHPGVPTVCYINTSAEVKAECDVCCTSANAERIIRALPEREIIFVPDAFMAKNLEAKTGKRLISWNATCIVHSGFDRRKIQQLRRFFPSLAVLAHSECPPEVAQEADMVGGTADMEKYVSSSNSESFLLLTECGLSDRLRAEFPSKRFVGSCSLCPYMKRNSLPLILRLLEDEPAKNEISIDADVARRARLCLERMFELSQDG
ncbi:MAG: quinolinate synthase NadA [Candidatus Micrarchaeota archaeon]|nr:quinolinate synthase NadA [Candidatus Micrarchaeota archaeon]